MRDLTRLSMLLELLKLIPSENFSLSLLKTYVNKYPRKKLMVKNENTDAIKDFIKDKVIASPIGWAGLYKPFNDMGFKLISEGSLLCIDDRTYFEADHGRLCQDLQAVLVFFDLSKEEAVHLFNGSSYSEPTIENVIDRLECFIKEERS